MAGSKSRLQQLREASPKEAVRLIWRKAIYRKVSIGEFGVRAGDTCAPGSGCTYRISRLARGDWGQALDNNPYLSQADLDRFSQQKATCIVALDGEHVAASTWMIEGPDEVFVDDIHRSVVVGRNGHFSCRSFVDPEYRGHALMGYMVYDYSLGVDEDALVWGPIFLWNVASVKTFERLGWRHRGDYWTTFLFGRKHFGERHFAPRPPIALGHT